MDGGYGYEISSASDDEPMRKLFARESFNPMPQAFLPSRLNNIIRLGTDRQGAGGPSPSPRIPDEGTLRESPTPTTVHV
ncbi:hypothetical protein LWI28_011827 [Acer negundo]|uniref:Uncharacterized protein n=1 Tax=Acer negundo TaxID=4023 RepID=A0AAD5ILH6_ACENE|nr:hypothetical protein LWI28_011827 [Acer negundo]